MIQCASFAVILSAVFIAGCSNSAAPDLPGSATFPLVEGSTTEHCPAGWLSDLSSEAVCVSAPNDQTGHAIVEAYQQALDERGFHFERYLGGPNVVVLTREADNACDIMIFGMPYLPKEQRAHLVLLFNTYQASAEDCARVERKGQR